MKRRSDSSLEVLYCKREHRNEAAATGGSEIKRGLFFLLKMGEITRSVLNRNRHVE